MSRNSDGSDMRRLESLALAIVHRTIHKEKFDGIESTLNLSFLIFKTYVPCEKYAIVSFYSLWTGSHNLMNGEKILMC